MTSRRCFIGAALALTAGQNWCVTAGDGFAELSPPTGPKQTDEECIIVRFLGTGAADWHHAPRDAKIYRRWTSILVDNRFLVDCTHMTSEMLPEGCRPKALLYTHSHPDHYDPSAAVKLGIKHVFVHRSWIEDARKDYEQAVATVGGEMPVLHPLEAGVRFRLGPYEILPLPANHYADRAYEQTLFYKVTKLCTGGAARFLYATDTSGIPSRAYFLGCRSDEPFQVAIIESCGRPGRKFDGLSISHNTADRVVEIFSTILKPGKSAYRPSRPDQKVYLTHLGCGDWGQNTFEDILPPGFAAAYDGQEIEVRPNA